jgi:hypothetical protein
VNRKCTTISFLKFIYFIFFFQLSLYFFTQGTMSANAAAAAAAAEAAAAGQGPEMTGEPKMEFQCSAEVDVVRQFGGMHLKRFL